MDSSKLAQFSEVAQHTDLSNIDRPISEKRLYHHVQLRNKLEVLLISDPDCERAACSLTVGVGSLHDPKDLQGCAHLLEHLVFLGTKKYPDEGEYSEYISNHGGSYNAFTAGCETCYHFSINPDSLEGAMDRLAQFFLEPQFNISSVERELKAVDSEHSRNLDLDSSRIYRIMKYMANPDHPISHFSTGSYQSLRPFGDDKKTREAVIAFYNKYYSANIMRLCVIGKEPLHDLLKYVTNQRFERIVNRNVQVPSGQEHFCPGVVPYRKTDLNKFIHVTPLSDIRKLIFYWVIPDQSHLWKTKPIKYMSSLVGHESKGSILSMLKELGYATRICSALIGSFKYSGYALFSCIVEMTELGTQHVKEIGETIYEYINMLKTKPVQDYLWKEMIDIANIHFEYKSVVPAEDHAVIMSESMNYFPPQYLLSGVDKIFDTSYTEIKDLLKYISVENGFTVMLLPEYKTENKDWETEPWYRIKYKAEPTPQHLVDAWKAAAENPIPNGNPSIKARLDFPPPNVYIPKDFSIKPIPEGEQKFPQKLSLDSCQSLHIYYKRDTIFRLPKTYAVFRVLTPFTCKSVRNATIFQLFVKSVAESMNEDMYNANEATLTCSLSSRLHSSGDGDPQDGCTLLVGGFHDTVPTLLKTALNSLKECKFTEKHFDIAKSVLVRHLKVETETKIAYEQAMYELRKLCQDPFYDSVSRLKCAEEITYADIEKSKADFLRGLSVEALISGNITEKEARFYADSIKEKFAEALSGGRSSDEPKFVSSKTVDFEKFNSAHSVPRLRLVKPAIHMKGCNNASLISIHAGPTSASAAAMLNVARKILHQHFFVQLRTKQQLGYVTSTRIVQILISDVLCFFVQSTAFDARELSTRIEAFLEHYINNIDSLLTDSVFEDTRCSTIALLREKPTSLEEEASRYLHEMNIRRYAFERREIQAKFLETLTRAEFIEYVKSLLKAPWITVEINAHNKSMPLPVNEMDHEIPLKPINAIAWEEVPENASEFMQKRAQKYISFPLPGHVYKPNEQ